MERCQGYSQSGGDASLISPRERAFLLKYTDMTEADFTDEALAAVDRHIARSQAEAARQVMRDALTGGEVATLFDVDEELVNRQARLGDLYSVTLDGVARCFPRWQFTTDSSPVPGLRRVLAALPDSWHPLDVESFMTRRDDDQELLEGMAPVEWLTSGRAIGAVVALADEMTWI